jgi:hypothetical protein
MLIFMKIVVREKAVSMANLKISWVISLRAILLWKAIYQFLAQLLGRLHQSKVCLDLAGLLGAAVDHPDDIRPRPPVHQMTAPGLMAISPANRHLPV